MEDTNSKLVHNGGKNIAKSHLVECPHFKLNNGRRTDIKANAEATLRLRRKLL